MHIYTGLQKIRTQHNKKYAVFTPAIVLHQKKGRDSPVCGEWFCISTQRASNYFDWVNVFKADEDTFAFHENLQYFYWNEKNALVSLNTIYSLNSQTESGPDPLNSAIMAQNNLPPWLVTFLRLP